MHRASAIDRTRETTYMYEMYTNSVSKKYVWYIHTCLFRWRNRPSEHLNQINIYIYRVFHQINIYIYISCLSPNQYINIYIYISCLSPHHLCRAAPPCTWRLPSQPKSWRSVELFATSSDSTHSCIYMHAVCVRVCMCEWVCVRACVWVSVRACMQVCVLIPCKLRLPNHQSIST